MKKKIAVLFIILALSSCTGCKKTNDIQLPYFGITLGEFVEDFSEISGENVPEFKTIKSELDQYIYKLTLSDDLFVIVHKSAAVNAFDVIINFGADNEDFALYAKCVGALINLSDESIGSDEIIEALSLDDFTQGTTKTFSTSSSSYEYNVYEEQIIFSVYKQ